MDDDRPVIRSGLPASVVPVDWWCRISLPVGIPVFEARSRAVDMGIGVRCNGPYETCSCEDRQRAQFRHLPVVPSKLLALVYMFFLEAGGGMVLS